MTIKYTIITTLLGATLYAAPVFSPKEIEELRVAAKDQIGPLPAKMPRAEADSPELVALGKKLYFEKRLSVNNTISCNSCHMVDQGKGGVDNEPTSPGAFGERGGRNSPTVLNAGLQTAQFWDGRAETLEHQAKGPILNPVEMAMPKDVDVLERLRAIKEYQAEFKTAFKAEEDPITYDNVAKAIAAFERTLITRDRFDDFLNGDPKALTHKELSGLKTFMEVGCTVCHNGPVLGGNSYQKIGLIKPFETADVGRFEVTKEEDDKFKFKVPILRNIEITGPYFHDGKLASLDEVVQKMAWHQLGAELSKEQVSDLVAFLRALTDKQRVPQTKLPEKS
jgi:cytochrome c peroxidase